MFEQPILIYRNKTEIIKIHSRSRYRVPDADSVTTSPKVETIWRSNSPVDKSNGSTARKTSRQDLVSNMDSDESYGTFGL